MKESIGEARRRCVSVLEPLYGHREAASVIDLLFDKCFGIDRLAFVMNENRQLDEKQHVLLDSYVDDLLNFRPVQYIIGNVDFCDCVIEVSPDALIPRPETAEMMSLIFDAWKGRMPKRIVDVCSGSGCIAVSAAKHFTGSEVVAFELSEKAIVLAELNARANNADVSFIKADMLSPSVELSSSPVDLIISNPPYICESERALMQRNVLDYEPDMALFVSDDDPLVFYRTILEKALRCLDANGEVWFEMNEAKSAEMNELCNMLGFSSEFFKDINGKWRFCRATIP